MRNKKVQFLSTCNIHIYIHTFLLLKREMVIWWNSEIFLLGLTCKLVLLLHQNFELHPYHKILDKTWIRKFMFMLYTQAVTTLQWFLLKSFWIFVFMCCYNMHHSLCANFFRKHKLLFFKPFESIHYTYICTYIHTQTLI